MVLCYGVCDKDEKPEWTELDRQSPQLSQMFDTIQNMLPPCIQC